MTEFGYLILFVLSFVLFPCEGKITSPPDGTNFTFVPGSTPRIQWKFDNDIKTVLSRIWSFTGSDGSESVIARIVDDDPPREIPNNTLPGVTIEKPATLVLNNVDKRYNGKYRFQLSATGVGGDFHVVVFIAEKPTVSLLTCPSPVLLNKGDDFTCECQGLGGNPPANVTWYKDGKKIGGTGTEKQILTLMNVDETDSATYKCMAESYPDAMYRDEKSIRVDVKFGPKDTSIELKPNPATLGESFTITCNSRGFPEPSYTISHNDTHLINAKTHKDNDVVRNDAGTYKCIAKNERGNASASEFLKVTERGTTPTTPSPSNTTEGSKQEPGTDGDGDDGGLGVGAIIGIVIGVLALLVIVIFVVWRFKLKEKDGYRGNRNVNQVEMDDNAYDTVKNEPSGSKSKPQASTLPVYAAVDKNNREGKPLYATLDTVAMNSDDSKRRSEESKPEPTQYASIDFGKSGEVPKADLV